MHIDFLTLSNDRDSKLTNLLTSESLSYSSSVYVMYNFDFKTKEYLFMSPSIEALTGFSMSELNKSGFKGIVREVYSNKLDRYSVDNNEKLSVEEFYAKYLIETKVGQKKWIEDNSFTYIDENGNRVISVGILRDTSSLQLFIDDLNEEKDNLSRVFDLSDTLLIHVNRNLDILMINKKGCRILGGEENDVIGKNIAEFIPSDLQVKFKKYIKDLLNEPGIETKYTQGKILSLDNQIKFVEWHNTLIRDKNGEVVSIISSGQEITEKRKEEKIRNIISEILDEANSEKDLPGLFKFIHQSISKLMKAENFYIAYYNREQNMLSFPYFVDKYDNDDSPQLLGKGLTEYVIRTGRSVLVDDKLDRELRVRGETKLIGPQSEIWLGVPLKIQNKIIGVMVVQDYENPHTYGKTEQQILDVVAYPISRAIERKMLEAEREELIVQLKDLNTSKDQLFSLISHDLRNPFNSLLGFAEILTTEYETLTKDEIREYIKVINESAKNLYGMTNNLLHYSRYQLGKYEYKPAMFKVGVILKNIIETMMGNIKKKDLLIINKIDDKLTVYADEDLLSIALNNIIENAIKYSLPGKNIKLSSENMGHPDDTANFVKLILEDEGVGIPKENLEKIEKKIMFSTTGTMREFGTGLGLLLSQDFMVMNKGQLILESKEQKGTKVTLLLPGTNNG